MIWWRMIPAAAPPTIFASSFKLWMSTIPDLSTRQSSRSPCFSFHFLQFTFSVYHRYHHHHHHRFRLCSKLWPVGTCASTVSLSPRWLSETHILPFPFFTIDNYNPQISRLNCWFLAYRIYDRDQNGTMSFEGVPLPDSYGLGCCLYALSSKPIT